MMSTLNIMNDEKLKKEETAQDNTEIKANIESNNLDDDSADMKENHVCNIPIRLFKRKLYVSLIGVFLGASYYIWSLTGHWDVSNNLQYNKIYIGIGLSIAMMIVIFCVVMLILEKQQKEKDKQINKHNILMFGLFLAMIGCIVLTLTIMNKSINGYHFSFEAPACFILAKLILFIGYVSLVKSKRSKAIGALAFLMKIVGSFALLNEAIEKTKLHIKDIGIDVMLAVAIFGAVLMTSNILSDAKDAQLISWCPCSIFSCC